MVLLTNFNPSMFHNFSFLVSTISNSKEMGERVEALYAVNHDTRFTKSIWNDATADAETFVVNNCDHKGEMYSSRDNEVYSF